MRPNLKTTSRFPALLSESFGVLKIRVTFPTYSRLRVTGGPISPLVLLQR